MRPKEREHRIAQRLELLFISFVPDLHELVSEVHLITPYLARDVDSESRVVEERPEGAQLQIRLTVNKRDDFPLFKRLGEGTFVLRILHFPEWIEFGELKIEQFHPEPASGRKVGIDRGAHVLALLERDEPAFRVLVLDVGGLKAFPLEMLD